MLHYITGTAVTLLAYYVLFFYLGTCLADYFSLPPVVPWLMPLCIFLLQYMFFPRLLDSMTRDVEWRSPGAEYPELEALVKGTQKGPERVTFGISPSPFPVVYGYEHQRRNYRIVASSGLMSALSPRERECVISREISHAVTGDSVSLSCTGLIPVLLFLFSWNLLIIGIGMGSLRGVRSVSTFGLFLWWLSKILYLLLYFASRAREIGVRSRPGDDPDSRREYDSVVRKIRQRQTQCVSEGETNLKTILAINFLQNTDPWRSYHEALNSPRLGPCEKAAEDASNPWNSWYELLSSHPILPTEGGERKPKLPGSLVAEMVASLMPILAFITGLLICHFAWSSPGLIFLMWGAAFYFTEVLRYPRIRSTSEMGDRLHTSPLGGTPLRVKGTLLKEHAPIFFPYMLFLQNPEIRIPVELKSLMPAETLYDDIHPEGEVMVSGWLRRNPFTYIEVNEVRKEPKKRLYRSYAILLKWLIAFGAISLGLFLILLQQREG